DRRDFPFLICNRRIRHSSNPATEYQRDRRFRIAQRRRLLLRWFRRFHGRVSAEAWVASALRRRHEGRSGIPRTQRHESKTVPRPALGWADRPAATAGREFQRASPAYF